MLLALLCALAITTAVLAHSQLIRSEPAANAVLATAPSQVKLFFDEPVNVNFSDVQVLDKNLARVDNGDLKLASGDAKQLIITLKPLEDGAYTVVWQVLSDIDGHVTRGNFAFGVGTGVQAAPAPIAPQAGASETAPLSVVVRWLNLLALLALIGGFFFRTILLERSLRAVPMSASAQNLLRTRWQRLTWAALMLVLLAHIASLLVETSLVSGVPLTGLAANNAISRTLFGTRFGVLWITRLVLLVALGIALGIGWRHRVMRLLALALGAGALLTVSLGGHSAAVGGGISLALFSDWLHLICVAIWVGGLVHFLAALITLWRTDSVENRTRWLAWMVPQFSAVALPATVVIALTGLYNSLLQIPVLDALIRTAYGETLTIKVTLFGVMIAFGAINLLIMSPRFRRAAQGVHPEQAPRLVSRFRLTVAAEVTLAIAAIFLAGLLTLEPPARGAITNQPAQAAAPIQQPSKVFLQDTAAPDVQVALTLKPPTENQNEFDVYVTDPRSSAPITNALRVMVQFTLLDQDVGLTTQIAESKGDGHYVTQGNFITLPGLWRLRVIVRRAGVEDATVEFPVYRSADNVQDATSDPQAMQWLELSDAVMNQLQSVRSKQDLNDGSNGVVVTEYEYRAPNAMRFTLPNGTESIALGPVQYDRDKSGQWTQRQRIEPLVFPNFDMSRQATNARRGRQETLNGELTQIVRFKIPDVSGPGTQFAEWISMKDHRLLQFAMVAPSHFMMQYYMDYDSPQIAIAAPANVPTATPVPPLAASNPSIQTGSRPGGLVTSDLEKSSAIVLLLGGVVLGWLASNRKRARLRRLILLALGLLAMLGSVGLFIHATTANATVDVSLAAPGKPLYDANCAVCHGATGHGDGPAAKSLPVAPFDLTTHVLLHDEQYLDAVITNGRGYMPVFKDKLTQDQIYQIISYTRLLALKAQQGGAQPGFTPGP